MTGSPSPDAPLSATLPGTWRLLSRIDTTVAGQRHADPALGSDPVALLIYDRAGHFSAQFMKRDRDATPGRALPGGPAGAKNNTQAVGGYDAYFGTYSVDDATGVVTQELLGALSPVHVGARLSRAMTVRGDSLVIALETTAWDGTPVTRTLTWERVG
ncbi:MAG TPA: lipocalin-like domain-containing protein [Gemmatimonadaceae bacterium]|nr:lipocalin-like domain-containing protein [Gemmatimonadaceae bacterium]